MGKKIHRMELGWRWHRFSIRERPGRGQSETAEELACGFKNSNFLRACQLLTDLRDAPSIDAGNCLPSLRGGFISSGNSRVESGRLPVLVLLGRQMALFAGGPCINWNFAARPGPAAMLIGTAYLGSRFDSTEVMIADRIQEY
jgi:hypothetical protein